MLTLKTIKLPFLLSFFASLKFLYKAIMHYLCSSDKTWTGLVTVKTIGIYLLITPHLLATERVGERAPTFRARTHFSNPLPTRIIAPSRLPDLPIQTSPSAVTSSVSSASPLISEPETSNPSPVIVPIPLAIHQIDKPIASVPVSLNEVTTSMVATSTPISESETNKAILASTPNPFTVHQIDETVGSILLEAMWNCDDHPLKEGETRLYIATSQDFALLPDKIQRLCTRWYCPPGNTFATIAFDVPQTILTSMRSKSPQTDASLRSDLVTNSKLLLTRAIVNTIFLETCSARENDICSLPKICRL